MLKTTNILRPPFPGETVAGWWLGSSCLLPKAGRLWIPHRMRSQPSLRSPMVSIPGFSCTDLPSPIQMEPNSGDAWLRGCWPLRLPGGRIYSQMIHFTLICFQKEDRQGQCRPEALGSHHICLPGPSPSHSQCSAPTAIFTLGKVGREKSSRVGGETVRPNPSCFYSQ